MTSAPHAFEIALCSWSTGAVDEPTLRTQVERFGLRAAQLSLGDLLELSAPACEQAIAAYRNSPLLLTAGMIGFAGEDYSTLATIRRTGGFDPDDTFEARLQTTLQAAGIAQALGLKLLSGHCGFIPPKSEAAAFEKLLVRLRRVADALAPLGITFLFETGQETADTLAAFLTALDRPNIGVNFDPANMVLYGKGDPVNAVVRLARWIKHVHAKDAHQCLPPPADADSWCGLEVPLGAGDARLPEVIATLHRVGYRGALAIEREAGTNRGKDIALGISFLREQIARLPIA